MTEPKPKKGAAWEKAKYDFRRTTYIHCRIEDRLAFLRDDRISNLTAANGLVIREFDGGPSGVIRLGTRDAIGMVLRLAAEYDKDPALAESWLREYGQMSECEREVGA